jgi:dihydropyrimidinase
LREKWNQEELWKGLAKDQLQVISTDHCPFCFKEQKELGKDDFTKIPNGGPGVENRLALVYNGGVRTGKISLNRWVELVSTAPAKMFGLFPRKGSVSIGSDADIVLFDPEAETTISASTHHMRVDYSLYEGWKIRGVSRKVYARGKLIVDGNSFLGRAGSGSFIPRSTYTGL